uniref:MARVEL domain-containing protein n=1 Tax=Parastrongyloides trichosuri TaxID=131310 RepID=A0A0N4ZY38_PARTI
MTIKKFNKNDSFYYAPAAFGLLHYKNAAILGAVLGITVLSCSGVSLYFLHNEYNITGKMTTIFTFIMIISFIITTILMVFGILKEKPNYIWPQMTILHLENALLFTLGSFSIISMACGTQTTTLLFSYLVNVNEIENYLGPIWPFNIASGAFVGCLICIWFNVLLRGAYDYLLDKQFFENKERIEMH